MAERAEGKQTPRVGAEPQERKPWRAPEISRISLDRTLSAGGSHTDGSGSDPGSA